MSESRAPRGEEWNDAAEALRGLTNVLAVRSHYPEGHPAIVRADGRVADGFLKLLAQLPELVVALKDDEFVICDRPMPELRGRLASLATAMVRHGIECLVFQRGIVANECTFLGRTLALASEDAGRIRELAKAHLVHVLVRFAAVRSHSAASAEGLQARSFLEPVRLVLEHVAGTFAKEELADLASIREVARDIVQACAARAYTLDLRCFPTDADDQVSHATNVAMMVASLALDGRLSHELCIEVTSAAILHDVGHLLLPAAIGHTPEPSLDEAQRRVAHNHPFAGALALLSAGCPPLWVAASLDHHRGIDGGGYPAPETSSPPHELVRLIALASFFDRKRTLVDGLIDDPEDTLRQALALESVYFGPRLVTRFLHALGVYPPGTMVELSDRQTGVVTHASPHDPLRPMVRLLTGANADRLVDLQERNPIEGRHELSIVRAILAPLALRDPEPEETGVSPKAAFPRPATAPASPQVEDLVARLGGLASVPVLAKLDLKGLSLDHRAGFLLTFVDGGATLGDLLDTTGLPRLDVLQILDSLVQASVIRMH